VRQHFGKLATEHTKKNDRIIQQTRKNVKNAKNNYSENKRTRQRKVDLNNKSDWDVDCTRLRSCDRLQFGFVAVHAVAHLGAGRAGVSLNVVTQALGSIR